MQKEELQKLRDKMSKELDIASQKLKDVEELHKQVEEEYNARMALYSK